MIDGSGAGFGSISLNNESGSGRPKNIWIPRIRIRNTDKMFTPLTSGTIRTDYFLVSSSTAICFKMYHFNLGFLITVQSSKQQNASNPQLLERTACIIVCAQAVLFSDKPVSNKCAIYTFYVRRTVWGLQKG